MSEPTEPKKEQPPYMAEIVGGVEALELRVASKLREEQTRRSVEMIRGTLDEIRSAAESAAVQNAVRAMELLIAAGDSLDPMVLKAVRLHLLAAGLFCVAAGSGAGEGIPNSEAGKRVM